MRRFRAWSRAFLAIPTLGAVFVGVNALGDPAAAARRGMSVSLLLEAGSSVHRAKKFLLSKQLPSGAWSGHPVITSYVTVALANSAGREDAATTAAITRASGYLAKEVQPDGSLWNEKTKQYPVYSTAISALGLIRTGGCDADILRRIRTYLLAAQCLDSDPSSSSYGGYGPAPGAAPDLTTTQWVLETLYLTDGLDRGNCKTAVAKADSAYAKAIVFVSRCQRSGVREGGHDSLMQPPGWFADSPEASTAGPSGSTPRGVGYLTFAGLKSLLYARVPRADQRVVAAATWGRAHYTTAENPGLGSVGLYTYLYTMAKALKAYEMAGAGLAPPVQTRWRQEVVNRLLVLQHGSGAWKQNDSHWWETQPDLVTAYALLTLQMVCGSELAGERSESEGGIHPK